LQYVWEWSLGSCGVPTVVGVNADLDGFVGCAVTYWHGEPAQPYPIGSFGEFIVSCNNWRETTRRARQHHSL
jgi:hypothetical protein